MSAGNLAKGGASYEAVLVDKMTGPLNNIINQIARLQNQMKQTNQVGFGVRMEKQVGRISKATRSTAFSSGITATIQSFMYLEQVVYRVLRLIADFGRIAYRAFSATVTAASNMTETMNAFNATFGITARFANNYFNNLVDTIGRSRVEVKRSATAFQGFFVGLGAGKVQAAALSTTMQQLAIDFGSFFNVADSEANRRFIAALSGSSEVLDSFGINIRENQLELKAQALGFGANVRKMTEYQKALTRAIIIFDTMSSQGAVGDAVKTSAEWANQVKALSGAWEDFLVNVGMPLKDVLLPLLQDLVKLMQDLAKASENAVQTFVNAFVVDAERTLSLSMELIGLSLYKAIVENFDRAMFRIGLVVSKWWENLFTGASMRSKLKRIQQLQHQLAPGPDVFGARMSDADRKRKEAELARLQAETGVTGKVDDVTQSRIDAIIAELERLATSRQGTDTEGKTPSTIGGLLLRAAAGLEAMRGAAVATAAGIREHEAAIKKTARGIRDATRTPLERFKLEINKLNALLGMGAINPKTFDRAALQAAETFQGTIKKEVKQATSTGGTSGIFARNASQFAPAFEPLLSENQKQTELLKTLTDNTNPARQPSPLAFN